MNLKILPKLMVAATLSIITPNNDANASAHTPPSCLTSGALSYTIDFDKTKAFIDSAQIIAPAFMKDFMTKQLPEKEKGIIGSEGLSEGISYSLWNALVSRTLGIAEDFKTSYFMSCGGSAGAYKTLIANEKLRRDMWQSMKGAKFVTSEIEDPIKFQYDPIAHFVKVVTANPGKPIIVGCGHHGVNGKYWKIDDNYEAVNSGGCANDHKNDITVDIDPTQLPTVIADARNLELWQSIEPGSILGITDESHHNIFFNPYHGGWNEDLMKAIHHTLTPGATFSANNHEKLEDGIIARMMGLGFDYKSPDGYIFIFTKTA